MSDKLNWGVMGNATIARVCVIPAIQKSRNGIVRALASRSPKGAADVRHRNRIGQLYDNYQALIDDPAIEAIYIPLPNYLHAEWAIKALFSGKHVLCEKPLACNARQAQEMAAAAATTRIGRFTGRPSALKMRAPWWSMATKSPSSRWVMRFVNGPTARASDPRNISPWP